MSELIHKIDVVAVLSECFDVFPTITLEALAHGKLVITTSTTGSFPHIHYISEVLAVDLYSNLDLHQISKLQKNVDVQTKIKELSALVSDFERLKPYQLLLKP